jgi:hypothetical protein
VAQLARVVDEYGALLARAHSGHVLSRAVKARVAV